MVVIMREERRKVYEYLLEEGVIVLKKDFNLPEHNDTKIQNLKVWMMMRSLHSKGMVELVFNW
jgi:small subunit ribosomal protein S10e